MEELNQVRGRKPSSKEHELRKKINQNDYCSVCKNLFNKRELEIEHPIPVCIGGDINIYSFYCKKCHNTKTKFDINFIFFLKKINILIKVGQYDYLIEEKEKIIQTYKEMYKIYENLINVGSN